MANTYEQEKALANQEYVLELYFFLNSLKGWMGFSSKIHQSDWEIDEDDENLVKYNWEEIVFNIKEKTATIMQYYDWERRPVSRLVKKDNEMLDEFLKRAEELNEKLWETICFEDR